MTRVSGGRSPTGRFRAADFDGFILTGGHAPGMRVYLGSGVLQSAVGDFFAQKKPVGAICHGVLLAARSSFYPGKSVLYGKKTTALTKQMELIAWRLTRLYLGDHYRTYPITVEDEAVPSRVVLEFGVTRSPAFREYPVKQRGQLADR